MHLRSILLQAVIAAVASAIPAPPGPVCTTTPSLHKLASYETGVFGKGASEIVSYDANRKHMLITNAALNSVDVIDIQNPSAPVRLGGFSANFKDTSSINSIDVYDNVAAIAVEGKVKTDPGYIEFWDLTTAPAPTFINSVQVCSQPDSVVFSWDGKWVLAPCEGEPNDDYSIDPEGAIAIVDVSKGFNQATFRAADFKAFNGNAPAGLRISSKAKSVAQDIEPEYIAVSGDSKTAYVSLQENNGLAVVDIASATVTKIYPLGYKDHSVVPLDANDRDAKINIRTFKGVYSMYMPDTVAYYESKVGCGKVKGRYVLTANEGDARGYTAFNDESRVSALKLDPTVFSADDAKALARLSVSNDDGFTLVNGTTKVFSRLHVFGSRSFSVWDADTGALVYDSADEFEQVTATIEPAYFNSNHEEAPSFDARSAKKGPEPEVLKVGRIGKTPLLFVGLERQSGILMYDISDVTKPKLLQYTNPRNWTAPVQKQGDLGPEGMDFVYHWDSPTGYPLLLVGNEVSGSTAVYEIRC
ncbi:hypothetical protein HDU96_003724 [Phlyctochytrium bullatum]|nr:hypothetical protein HDU96_003724 [Phlyctochytrium bullatum]